MDRPNRRPPSLSRDRERIADGQCDDRPFSTLDPDLVDAAIRSVPRALRRRELTAKQKLRIKRNCVIKAANKAGISQRTLAEVFRLRRATIWDIVQGNQTCGRPRGDADREGDS